jgi:hypothetical protein
VKSNFFAFLLAAAAPTVTHCQWQAATATASGSGSALPVVPLAGWWAHPTTTGPTTAHQWWGGWQCPLRSQCHYWQWHCSGSLTHECPLAPKKKCQVPVALRVTGSSQPVRLAVTGTAACRPASASASGGAGGVDTGERVRRALESGIQVELGSACLGHCLAVCHSHLIAK